MSKSVDNTGMAARKFVKDIEAFLFGRPITYVDVGAHVGGVMAVLADSPVRVRTAHLIEPNPSSFKALQEAARELDMPREPVCHNVAVSATPGTLTMVDDGTMTHVAGAGARAGERHFTVPAVTLDELARTNGIDHIDLLKVDVEGHELAVFEGAKGLLSTESVDVIYVEAGADSNATQQVYYRRVEDALHAYGYRLFGVYEQTNEWPTDSPLLRRMNLCFMSESFATSHPHKLSKELYRLRQANEALEVRVADLSGTLRESQDRQEAIAERASEAEANASAMQADVAERVAVQQARRAAESDRDAFVQYADELERRYRMLLRSSSWRLTGPLRVGVRTARRVLGKPTSGRNRLPTRPSMGAASLSAEAGGAATTAANVIALVKAADYPRLYELKCVLEADLASADSLLGYSFLSIAWARQTSTFAFGAQTADAVFNRYRHRRGELVQALGKRAHVRLLTDAAVAFTRVGRYDDARELLDREIASGLVELLPLRAEVSWIHDPHQAADDLRAHIKAAGWDGAGRANLLLNRHVLANVLDRPSAVRSDDPVDQEFRLVDAIRAAKDGRHADYRRLVNDYFADQGLTGPLDVMESPFSFEDLTSGQSPASDGGPLVSVIMTTFNSAQTVRYAIESIVNQTHRNIELLIVDDGSTDATRDTLNEIAAVDDRVKLIFNKHNIGTYAAKNRAMDLAQGTYITFHDSDDWAHPQRTQVHLDAMEGDPTRMATRSTWLRVYPDGVIDFRRWQKRLAHPNPASVFIRREVIEQMGYFDTVRFGADSEFWYRAQRVFGRQAVVGLRECLGLGRQHEASLTRSGLGARNAEEYSAVRGAYQYSWFEWHATSSPQDLHLPAEPGSRRFWAADGMVTPGAPESSDLGSLAMCYPGLDGNSADRNFVFGISLASKAASKDWAVTQRLLGRTLRSVANQTDGRWRAIVCGHERPDLPELDDPRVMFMVSDLDRPKNSGQFRKDKMWKRRLIGSILRDLGGGYFCPLDADDLVHRDLVKHVLADDNKHGYRIDSGYVEDLANERVAPVPGAWSASFDRVCGTSAVLYFDTDELPLGGAKDDDLYFNLFQSHAYWPVVAEEWGRPLAPVPFPAAVYVVNHSQNLSFGLQRSGDRTDNILAAIERHAVADRSAVLSGAFGQAALEK